MRRIFLWLKRFLIGVAGLFCLYQSWLFGWVYWWNNVNPDMTRFMEIRLAEIQAREPQRQLKKRWVFYNDISIHLKRALIASEDSQFVHHEGFDWEGIQRAVEKNDKRGKIVAGGSSISQQLAKNLLLTPDKTPLRKLQEAVITLMIEATWSKQRIFEVYINVIEWGDGVFGAEAAARHYFDVAASQLSPEQAARLASMVPSPRYYDRNRNAPGLVRKSAVILQRMPLSQIP